jgi:UDP-glucose 4-epimerase
MGLMKTAWITGIKGFIGRHLSKRLARSGVKVAGVDLSAWPEDDAAGWGAASFVCGDLSFSNLDELASKNGTPDCIFHLAGGSSVGLSIQTPEEDFRRTVDSSLLLLEWIRNRADKTKVVLSSSAAVYGAAYSRPISENAVTMPYSPYGYHKRISELLFESYSRNFGLKTAVVRLFSVYGPELRKQLLWDLCTRLREKPSNLFLSGTGTEKRDWLHVEDAADYLIRAGDLAGEQNFIINGGTGTGVEVRDIARRMADAWGFDVEIGFSGISRPGDPPYLVADTSLGTSLGFSPGTDWRAGVREYFIWFYGLTTQAGHES